MNGFSYEEREAYLHEQEQRRDQEGRMREEPTPPTDVAAFTEDQKEVIQIYETVIAELDGMMRFDLDNKTTCVKTYDDGKYVLFDEVDRLAKKLIQDKMGYEEENARTQHSATQPTRMFIPSLCPICGHKVDLIGRTEDGTNRLIGSCGDAFTQEQWEEE